MNHSREPVAPYWYTSPHCNLFSPTVQLGLRGPAAKHPAHAHLWLDTCLRGEPLQILPASHLHTHAAGALRGHRDKRPLPLTLLEPQTFQDPKGLGEGWSPEPHITQRPLPNPKDKPRVSA